MVGSTNDDDLNDILKTYGGDDILKTYLPDGNSKNHNEEMAPLNLEKLSEGNIDVPVKNRNYNNAPNVCFSLFSYVCLYSSYICEYAPKLCCGLATILLIVPAYFIILAIFNPTENFGYVANDYTSITSQYDLSVGKIDHWCLQGDNDSCMCEDPLQPQPRGQWKKWTTAHEANKQIIQKSLDAGIANPDIAFMGASVVEEMDGRWFGEIRDDPNLKSINSMFKKNFGGGSGSGGGDGNKLSAVALGIAGDTSPSVLWRLMNGEMPTEFNPKIWWLEVGMNDLGRAQCSEEVVVLGVLRVVEELLNEKPDAKIVINSLFPMADLRGGLRVGKEDFKKIQSKEDYIAMMKAQKQAKLGGDMQQPSYQQYNKRNHVKKLNHRGEFGKNDFGERAGVVRVPNRPPPKAGGGARAGPARKNNKPQNRNLRWFGKNNDAAYNDKKDIKLDSNKHQQKKYTTLTHQERKLPLWTSISAINKELKKFASKNDRVSFFDATSIFAEKDEATKWILKKKMISIRGHPTPAGFGEWETQVSTYAKKLLLKH